MEGTWEDVWLMWAVLGIVLLTVAFSLLPVWI